MMSWLGLNRGSGADQRARRHDRDRETKASAVGRLVSMYPDGRPVWSPRDPAVLAREGFERNAIVYRAVRMVAENAASVPWLLFDGDREIADHPLLRLLARPNPRAGGPDLFEALFGHLMIAGNGFLEAVTIDGEVAELHCLRPDRMQVVPGPDGWPAAFDYRVAGRGFRFEQHGVPPPILHLSLFHPGDDHYGMSPLAAAQVPLDIHNAASGWNKALLDNAARPSGALVHSGTGSLTEAQIERLKRELEETFQGASNAGRPMLLDGGLDWRALSLSPRDMDFIEAKHVAAREIALAFGVPPMLLGIPGDNTYANYQEANRAFWRHTLVPLLRRAAKAMTAWLGPAWPGDLRLDLDWDQVDALAAEREARWAAIKDADFLTVNERRAAVGYGVVEGGDAPPPAVAGEDR